MTNVLRGRGAGLRADYMNAVYRKPPQGNVSDRRGVSASDKTHYVRGNLDAPAFHLPEGYQVIRRCASAQERQATQRAGALLVFTSSCPESTRGFQSGQHHVEAPEHRLLMVRGQSLDLFEAPEHFPAWRGGFGSFLRRQQQFIG